MLVNQKHKTVTDNDIVIVKNSEKRGRGNTYPYMSQGKRGETGGELTLEHEFDEWNNSPAMRDPDNNKIALHWCRSRNLWRRWCFRIHASARSEKKGRKKV